MKNKIVMNGADAWPPTLKQLQEARGLSAFYFPRAHPSIIAAIATSEQAAKPKGRIGRPHDSQIDQAVAHWKNGSRNIDDYADLLPNDERRVQAFRSLKFAVRKRLNAEILAEEAKNLAFRK